MKRILRTLGYGACIVGAFSLIMLAVFGEAALGVALLTSGNVCAEESKENTVTMTQDELKELINHHVAVALKEDVNTRQQQVTSHENWNVTIFRGVEYTIYSGPGQVVSMRQSMSYVSPRPSATPIPLPSETKK